MTDRRFIEESFPVKEVGEVSAYEKNVRHGHISTLHIWWARRPLAASRATAYAALTPAPKDAEEWQKKRDFIIQLSQWENSNNQSLLERARREILEANGAVPPKVLDPFSGGGSYPLEALRLGCDSYANDYNPVAVLIEKATLEYPQKFGRPFEGMPDWAKPQMAGTKDLGGNKKGKKKAGEQIALFDPTTVSEPTDFNPLLNAVRYWGEWVLEEARKELNAFFPPDPDGSTPVGYVWARTIPCQNPSCGQDIPLIRQYWLAKKDKKKVSLYPKVVKGKLDFDLIGDGYKKWPQEFTPENGTVSQAVATCPVCGSTIAADTTRKLFQDKKSGQKMIAVILGSKRGEGKKYRLATEKDIELFGRAKGVLKSKQESILAKEGFNPIPDEIIHTPNGEEYRPGGMLYNFTPVMLYGMTKWGDLFNDRQLLSLIVFSETVRNAGEIISKQCDDEFAKAVTTYLALIVSRCSDFESTLVRWFNHVENSCNTFARQALPMTWDYLELNLLSPISQGTFVNVREQILRALSSVVNTQSESAKITQGSATQLSYPGDYFDAVLTDPPYYDNVPYADLSDYFYVWLKRMLGNLHSDLFSTPNTPKSLEAIAELPLLRGMSKELASENIKGIKSLEIFEKMLKASFQEIYRVLKPTGITVIVYAHKSTEGWETIINALLDSGLVISGAWPLNTEMQGRLRSQESAALASSIYIVARKSPRLPTGFYNDVRAELNQHLDAKLHRLWEEGIGGGDFFIAAIGSAIEVFGKYEQVMDYEGNIVRADRLLEEVRSIATNYAVKQILHNGFASEITPMARFYVLWRWNYGEALVPFDEANKLAHSCGLDLSLQFSKNGFIKKEKEFVRMLGPQGRKLDDLDDPRDMIDVMHKSLLLWEKGQRGEMVKALVDRGFGRSEAFYRVAQAISETLPNESKEKKLLDGFLAGRERVQEAVEMEGSQGKLWE
ncbi:MAG: DUF1156 domain-containing protein [Anaerolineales bacterium]|nr:DUF1156 domain-containing protein [Anaerolineales bacterium]